MRRFRYGNLKAEGIYVDEDVKRMANTHQVIMSILIDSLLQSNDLKRALAVCQKWQQEMPQENVPYTEYALSMARCFYLDGQVGKADEIVGNLMRRADEWLSWIETIKPSRQSGSLHSAHDWMETMQQALSLAYLFERKQIVNQYYNHYEHYLKQYPQ